MTDLTSLENVIQLKQEINRLTDENRKIKEKLEYFTDKYGIPNEYKPTVEEEVRTNNLIDMETTNINAQIYKKLVDESIRDLLKLQLNELLEIIASQNKQSVMIYNSLNKLKDQLKDK